MIRATEHPVSRVTNRDQIAWAANRRMEPPRRQTGTARGSFASVMPLYYEIPEQTGESRGEPLESPSLATRPAAGRAVASSRLGASGSGPTTSRSEFGRMAESGDSGPTSVQPRRMAVFWLVTPG